jgi:Tfp pilus assembly protein PilN
MAIKTSINLLKSELFPEKKRLTLVRMCALWLIALVLMVSWSIFNNYQYQNIVKQQQLLTKEKQRQSVLVTNLEKEITSKKADVALTDKLNTIKLLLQHKQALHTKLTDAKLIFVSGFATAMSELSTLHHKGIRLQGIHIRNDEMYFTGLARQPEAVPAWLDGFQQSQLLSGKSFVGFKLSKNDDNITEFVVSSTMNKDAIK